MKLVPPRSLRSLPPEGARSGPGNPDPELVPPRSLRSLPPEGARSGPGNPDPEQAASGDLLGARALSKLRWRCRRGLLENDLFIERFFRHHEETITTRQAAGLNALMDLPDNDLLDLLLARKLPEGELDRPEVRDVLLQMRLAPMVAKLQS